MIFNLSFGVSTLVHTLDGRLDQVAGLVALGSVDECPRAGLAWVSAQREGRAQGMPGVKALEKELKTRARVTRLNNCFLRRTNRYIDGGGVGKNTKDACAKTRGRRG